jgi:hypothetical protein
MAAQPAAAQAAPFCGQGEVPRFSNGLARLASVVGPSMGQPTECEHTETPGGDVVQRTSTGLAYWRKSTNVPTFTTGAEHWAVVDDGLEAWTGTSVDPPRQTLRQIEGHVSQLRGLAALEPVAIKFIDAAEVSVRVAREGEETVADPLFAGVPRMLVLLGLLGPDDDLLEISRRVGEEQVVGVYDDVDKILYVAGAPGDLGVVERVSFAHEYTHALQDQHFDLHSLLDAQPDNDHARALTALVEGDAVNSAVAWAQAYLSPDELRELLRRINIPQPTLEAAPLVVRAEGLFPYDAGPDFVAALSATAGNAGVDSAFGDPPQSTRQVLHPDAYAAHEGPVEVDLPDLSTALGGGWRQAASNVLGALDLQILIEQYADHPAAVAATAGWGGDRWALLDRAGQSALVLRTTWDSDTAARAFYDAFTRGLLRRFPETGPTLQTDSSQALTVDSASTSVRLQERSVTFVLAPDRGTVELIEGALQE